MSLKRATRPTAFFTLVGARTDTDGLVRLGLAVQRTKVYQMEIDIQRGFFVGSSYKASEVAAYVFNPAASPTVVLAVSVGF